MLNMYPEPRMTNTTKSSLSSIYLRAGVLSSIREYFSKQQVTEVETPLLSPYAIPDQYIDLFHIQKKTDSSCYLHSSPENHMKQLLAMGSGDIYQICKVFRKEEQGRHHLNEFSMLEWYRIGFDDLDLIEDVAKLVNYCVNKLKQSPLERQIISYEDCFQSMLNISALESSKEDLANYCQQQSFQHGLMLEDDKDCWLNYLMCCHIEPYLSGSITSPKMVFVIDFPASQAALAQVHPDNNGNKIAKRFECYMGGIELANGYLELLDAKEQSQRFEKENKRRHEQGRQVIQTDPNLIKALESGIPACAGVALGIDRFIMLLGKLEHIHDSIPFAEHIHKP